MTRKHLVVSYDVTDDRARARLAKYVLGYFDRVQKSVFEGKIDEDKCAKLAAGVARLVDQEQDSVRFYTLCARCCPTHACVAGRRCYSTAMVAPRRGPAR